MEITALRPKPKKKMINKKIVAGAVIATTATAAGGVMATTRGRNMVRKVIDRQEPETTTDRMLITWMQDAYAMEDSQIKMLRGIIKDFKDDKEISAKLEQHLKQTEKQKNDVEKCLKSIGEKPSKSKELMGRIGGLAPAIDTKLFKDKKVKDMLMMHSGEHFEHASYLALAEAANAEGKKSIANTMIRIAKEEKEMAAWVEKFLPTVTRKHIKS